MLFQHPDKAFLSVLCNAMCGMSSTNLIRGIWEGGLPLNTGETTGVKTDSLYREKDIYVFELKDTS